jgi:ribosomal protein S18 acetylase RimI-like enzyme
MSATVANNITIRWAENADEERLVEIDGKTWSPLVTPAPPPAEPAFFRPHVEPADTLVAEIDSRIVGYALIGTPTPLPASARVQMIRGRAVDPEFQGKGIGGTLIDASIAEATARGAVKLSLRVLSTNEGARRLYASAGFETEGVLADEFLLEGRSVDDHLLARRLDQ